MEFDDKQSFTQAAASPEMADAVQNVANFADSTQLPIAFVEHVTIVD